MTSTAVSKVTVDEAKALEAWAAAQDEAWEDDGNSDIQPSFPMVKIVQPVSTMQGAEKHVGEFYHSDLDLYTPELSCVGLVKRETRALFGDESEAPRCMSADGVAPLPAMPLWNDATMGPEPQFCEQCPFSAWHDDTPPACRLSLVLLVDRGEAGLAQLRIGGKSIKPYKQFVARKLRPRKLPLYSQRLTLYTEMKSEPNKRWAELVIESETMTPTEALRYNHILQDQRKRFEETIAADGGQVEAWVDDHAAPLADDRDLPFE